MQSNRTKDLNTMVIHFSYDSVVIEDDVNFIVGFVESNHVKIIINVKIKHIQC